jgi:hypothetical protein
MYEKVYFQFNKVMLTFPDAGTIMTSHTTTCLSPGTRSMKLSQSGLVAVSSPDLMASSSAANGNVRVVHRVSRSTSVQVVIPGHMELSSVPELRYHLLMTPYKPSEWLHALKITNLLPHFHKVPIGLYEGFIVDFPTISCKIPSQ